MLEIRLAQEGDLKVITEIYNHFILRSTSTFDVEPKTLAEQKIWFNSHDGKFPILVGVIKGRVIGWASLSRWSTRSAYAKTAELSLYIRENCHNTGYGRKMLEALIDTGKDAGIHTILARIVVGNKISIRLHQKLGFSYIGTMREVGRKFGQLLDVVIMQFIYPGGNG